jgi:hypothetical protein
MPIIRSTISNFRFYVAIPGKPLLLCNAGLLGVCTAEDVARLTRATSSVTRVQILIVKTVSATVNGCDSNGTAEVKSHSV